MDPITQTLTGLGPWGIVAAVALTWFAPKVIDMARAKWPGLVPGDQGVSKLLGALNDAYRQMHPASDPRAKVAALLAREVEYTHCLLGAPKEKTDTPPAAE